ncbi:MAG: hypothetical protein JSS01_02795, partial [Proteobacteria bacterium]|nr:hypothetical protein [Pseudomonadota bacterium]
SLDTKDHKEANLRAKPVLMEFDRILAKAEAATAPKPLQNDLPDATIERLANHHYAALLAQDEELRTEGLSGFPDLAATYSEKNGAGFNDSGMQRIGATIAETLAATEDALARGNISHVEGEVAELLDLFRINLSATCTAYRKLSMAVLRQ